MGKKTKGKDDKGKKGKPRSDNGAAEIAAAEKKLARALANVDAARMELAARERRLADLLQQHGRMPSMSLDTSVEVPLFDQVQRLTEVNDVVVARADARSGEDG